MSATLHVSLRDVTLHDAGHYFLTVQYITRDGEEKKLRTEVSTKTNKPEFKNRVFSLPVRASAGVLDDAELQFGAFLVVRSERDVKEGERTTAKGTAKLAGLCTRQIAELSPALAGGAIAESIVLTHPEGGAVGSLVVELRIEMGPGAVPLRPSPEQLEGAAFELVIRNGVNLNGVTGGGSGVSGAGGLVVAVAAVCRGVTGVELTRTGAAMVGPLVAWNTTLVVRPRAKLLDAYDGLSLTLRPAAGGEVGALARVHLPLASLRDETARELRLELAEASGAALHVSVRKLPPSQPVHSLLELEVRQLRPSAPGLTLPPAGAVTVALFFKSLADYAPASNPWRHAYVPPAPGATEVLTRMMQEPPSLANSRAVTWAVSSDAAGSGHGGGGESSLWPQQMRWTLDGATSAPGAGSGVVLEFYSPEWMPADGGAPGGDACEWRLWAHATLPMPNRLQTSRGQSNGPISESVSVPFEMPLVLAREVAALPGAQPAPIVAGSLRLLPPPPPPPSASQPAAQPQMQPQMQPTPAQVLPVFPPISGLLSPADYAHPSALAGAPHSQLLAELEQKQGLIDRLLREIDARTSALSRVGHELVELRDRHGVLEAQHGRTARELGEKERVLDRLALDASQVEHIDPAELGRRHRMLGGAYRAEKARSDELAKQLSLLSSRVGQASRLESAYVSLQDAHRAQASELQRLQADNAQMPKYKSAVKSQEKLIAKLESLVKQAMRDARNAKETAGDTERLRKRVAELESQHADAAGIGTEEHVRLVMRAEQSDRRATATEAELAENARKYAREIAGLKVRLAEKEAELLGGFGAPQPSPGAGGGYGGHALNSFPELQLQPSANTNQQQQHLSALPLPPAHPPPAPQVPSSASAGTHVGKLAPSMPGVVRRGSASKLESLVPRTPPPASPNGPADDMYRGNN